LDQKWFNRDPHGVSRCDTGGLAGRIGGFKYLNEKQALKAVKKLSHRPRLPWRRYLGDELRRGFADLRSYLRGEAPKLKCRDARQICINGVLSAAEVLDRRLWTWEARGFAEIRLEDVDAVALAPEAGKELEDRLGGNLPARVEFLIGHATATGIHHFLEDQVVLAFEGA
jgi:hypothetical protein